MQVVATLPGWLDMEFVYLPPDISQWGDKEPLFILFPFPPHSHPSIKFPSSAKRAERKLIAIPSKRSICPIYYLFFLSAKTSVSCTALYV